MIQIRKNAKLTNGADMDVLMDVPEKRVDRISMMTETGFSLEDIKRSLAEDSDGWIRDMLRAKEQEYRRKLELCRELLHYYEKEEQVDREGEVRVRRMKDGQSLALISDRACRVFCVGSEGIEFCEALLKRMYTRQFIDLDIGDIPAGDAAEDVLIQVLEVNAGEMLASDFSSYFTESERLNDIRRMVCFMEFGENVELAFVDQLAEWICSDLDAGAVFSWGACIDPDRNRKSVRINLLGFYQ